MLTRSLPERRWARHAASSAYRDGGRCLPYSCSRAVTPAARGGRRDPVSCLRSTRSEVNTPAAGLGRADGRSAAGSDRAVIVSSAERARKGRYPRVCQKLCVGVIAVVTVSREGGATRGKGEDETIEDLGGEVEDRREESSVRGGGGGLVLPQGVLADLAEQLAARARAGESAQLTGPGGLLTGLMGRCCRRAWPPSSARTWRRARGRTGGTGRASQDAEHRGGAGAAGGPAGPRRDLRAAAGAQAGPPVRRP